MLGGYYLGQLYLGISGLPSSGSLSAQNAEHSHSVDNITLIQHHIIALADASHSLTSDNIDLIENKTLVVASATHGLTSDVIALLQNHLLVVADTLHGLTSDNITLLQNHLLTVAGASHDHTVDGDIALNQFFLLNKPDDSLISLSSPELSISQHHLMVIEDSLLGLMDNLGRIIYWADYQYFSGIFIKDFSLSGDLEENGDLDAGMFILKNKQTGSFEPQQIDSGVFIKTMDKQGNIH